MAVFFLSRHHRLDGFEISQKRNILFGFKDVLSNKLSVSGDRKAYTSVPVVVDEINNFVETDLKIRTLKSILPFSENNFAGIEFNPSANDFIFVANSDRVGRARMFFVIYRECILFSDDLRELLPYSSRRISYAGVYSVVKFGEAPEFLTAIEDIFSIPVGSYLELDDNVFDEFIIKKSFLDSSCIHFYSKIVYNFEGGNLDRTLELLRKQYRFLAGKNPVVPVSGGIDSCLINFLINETTDEKYPAYFLKFGDKDSEEEFARKAVVSTKAELEVITMRQDDFIKAFEFQNERIIHPVGESSPIALGHFFSLSKFNGCLVVDGTMADGCYGSTSYARSPFHGIEKRTAFALSLNEKIATYTQKNYPLFGDRFWPRDSMMHDEYVKFLGKYIGPFANTWFKDAQKLNAESEPYWKWYYKLIQSDGIPLDDWMKVSVFKMVNYAAKVTTAKILDIGGVKHPGTYPFMWKSVLDDQGRYSWEEKTKNGVIKYPLKTLLENYISKDFIYRKKVGLNSKFEDWVWASTQNKDYIYNILETGTVSKAMLGGHHKQLLKLFRKNEIHPNLCHLAISLSMQDAWAFRNNISV